MQDKQSKYAYNRKWVAEHSEQRKAIQNKADRKRSNNPNRLARHRETSAAWYLTTQKQQRRELRDKLNRLKLSCGCMHPECCWGGKWEACMLDFHHLDPTLKIQGVAVIHNVAAAITEINKCTVLCTNCHRLVTWGFLSGAECKACHVTQSKWDLL